MNLKLSKDELNLLLSYLELRILRNLNISSKDYETLKPIYDKLNYTFLNSK